MLETGALYGPGLDQFGLVHRAAPGRARRAAGRCAVRHGGGAEVPRALGRRGGIRTARPTSPRRAGSRLRRAKAARSACCCATSRAMRRARRARAGRSRPRQACRTNSAASAAPPSGSLSRATAAALAAPGHSRGIIMSASSRRYLSVWLRRLPTDRIAKRSRAGERAGHRRTGQERVAALRRERRRGGARPARRHAARRRARDVSEDRGRGCGRCAPTSRCSKRSPTGATAIRRWSGSIRPTG